MIGAVLTVTPEVIAGMVDALVREIDPQRIYLFGSRARGEAGEASDTDLLIVERDSFGPDHSRLQELRRIRKALSPFKTPKDVLVYSEDELAEWRDSVNHVIGTCLREGVLLYVRE